MYLNLILQTINNCYWMFFKCEDITEINLSKFDTSKVTDMTMMFYSCSSLSSLGVTNFNTKKVKHMDLMFNNCSSLTYIELSSFNTSECNGLVGIVDDIPNLTISMKNISIVENLIEEIKKANNSEIKIEFIDK